MNRIGSIVVGLLLILILLSSTLFVVDQRQFAVVYALGEIKEVVAEPGLKFKMPAPLQNVVFLDRRIQTLDSPESRPIFTAEKKSLVIDWLVKWRIVEPKQFIRNNGVDLRNAENRLAPIVQAALNEEVTKRDVGAVLSAEREKVMQGVIKRLVDDAKSFGIEVVDVRIKRVDFAANITESVYRRMESERKAKKSVPMPIASAKSSWPRPTVMRRSSRVMVMPRPRPSMPKLLARTRRLPSSIAAWKPIAPPSAASRM
jgi:membrane protease subunit HflC